MPEYMMVFTRYELLFKKRYDNILRDITAIKRALASTENNELTFELVKYQDPKGEDLQCASWTGMS
jgi:hypothetical protein